LDVVNDASRSEKRRSEDSKNVKIFEIGKVVLEKFACKEKMVTLSDHLSATG
jgi:hypothetical protein